MAEDFHVFVSPSPTALYSEEFFKSLTFKQASCLNLPVIAPPHSVSGWSFSPEILLSASANLVLPCEATVPCMASILPILRDMQEAFARGMRSGEDAVSHGWVFRCHVESAGAPPGLLVSDRHPSVISSAATELPLTDHIYCMFHLNDNVTTNLRSKISVEWPNFQNDFWATYRAVSPEEFERLWKDLVLQYPSGRDYLEKELYVCREKWAWAWVSSKFTAGIRTNGRIEVENRVNKQFGGPKSTCFQLFKALNE